MGQSGRRGGGQRGGACAKRRRQGAGKRGRMRVAAGEAGRNGEGACALREGGASAPGRMRSGCVAQLPLKEPPPFCVYTPHPLRYGAGFGRFPHRGAAGGAAPAHQADAGKRVGAYAHTEEFGGGGAAILPPPIPTPRYVPPPYRRRSAPAASTTWSTSRKRTRGCRRRIRVRGSGGRGTHRDISPLPTRIGVWGLLPEPPPPTPVFLLSLSLLPDQAAGALHHGQG